jgi:hypothetical protein
MQKRSEKNRRASDQFLKKLSRLLDVFIAYADKETNVQILNQSLKEISESIKLSENVFGRRGEDVELQLQIMAKLNILAKRFGHHAHAEMNKFLRI